MIDLTPLDVRKKRGDFVRGFRGYDTQQVDAFLELAAERLEELVKQNMTLSERVERLAEQVEAQAGREQAVNDALVTAQQLREDIHNAADREAEAIRHEAQADADRLRSEAESEASRVRTEAASDADRIVSSAERRVEELQSILAELERRRARFLGSFRKLLERELDNVEVQEGRPVDDDVPVELDLGPRPLPPVVDMFASADADTLTGDEGGEGPDAAAPAEGEPAGEPEDAEGLAAAHDRDAADESGAAEGRDATDDPDAVRRVTSIAAAAAAIGLDEDDIDHEFVPSSFETVEEAEILASTMERIEQTPLGVFDPAPPVPLPNEDEEDDQDEGGDETEASAMSDTPAVDEPDPSLRPPEPEADVHRLASDTRLAADPPPSGTDWLEADENDDDR